LPRPGRGAVPVGPPAGPPPPSPAAAASAAAPRRRSPGTPRPPRRWSSRRRSRPTPAPASPSSTPSSPALPPFTSPPDAPTPDPLHPPEERANAAKVSESEFIIQTERRVPSPGDIVYSRELSFGWGVVVPEGTTLCLSQGMVLFRPAEGILATYLSMCLNDPI